MTCRKKQLDLCSPVGDLCSPVEDRGRMIDPTPFIGKPYRVGARGPDAFDCWGLVMACCPWMPDDWADEDMAVRKIIRVIEGQMRDDRWERVGEPCAGAVAIFGTGGRATHTGLLWPVSGGVRVVHALQGVGVITQTLSAMQRMGLNLKGAYLWRG
jgi:hypothetical protein